MILQEQRINVSLFHIFIFGCLLCREVVCEDKASESLVLTSKFDPRSIYPNDFILIGCLAILKCLVFVFGLIGIIPRYYPAKAPHVPPRYMIVTKPPDVHKEKHMAKHGKKKTINHITHFHHHYHIVEELRYPPKRYPKPHNKKGDNHSKGSHKAWTTGRPKSEADESHSKAEE